MARYRAAYQRWPFHHRLKNGKTRTYWMKVILGWTHAYPILRAEHVMEAIRRKGVGDTQNCAEAVCAQRNPEAYVHPIEGTIDFTYSRAAVVSKIYREPRRLASDRKLYVQGECVVYAHDHADIARLNDSPRGQKKLLLMLRKNGPLQQHFRPIKLGTRTWAVPPSGRKTGTRTRFKRGKAREAFAIAALETPTT